MGMHTAGCASERHESSSCRPGNTRRAVHYNPAALLREPLSLTKLLPSKLEGEKMAMCLNLFIFHFLGGGGVGFVDAVVSDSDHSKKVVCSISGLGSACVEFYTGAFYFQSKSMYVR